MGGIGEVVHWEGGHEVGACFNVFGWLKSFSTQMIPQMYVTYPERAMLGLGAHPPWTSMQKRQKGGKKKENIMDAYTGIKEALIGISASRQQG